MPMSDFPIRSVIRVVYSGNIQQQQKKQKHTYKPCVWGANASVHNWYTSYSVWWPEASQTNMYTNYSTWPNKQTKSHAHRELRHLALTQSLYLRQHDVSLPLYSTTTWRDETRHQTGLLHTLMAASSSRGFKQVTWYEVEGLRRGLSSFATVGGPSKMHSRDSTYREGARMELSLSHTIRHSSRRSEELTV